MTRESRQVVKWALGLGLLTAVALVSCGSAGQEKGKGKPVKSGVPSVGGCQIFPADNPWNMDISKLPVHPNSANFVKSMSMGSNTSLHPDFSVEGGIPYVLVKGTQKRVPITFEYPDESDPGPYPIPDNAPIEGGPKSDGDRHVLVVDTDNCKLYEVWRAFKVDVGWKGGSGAIFDLKTGKLRPLGWTSSDAAGLPVLPGLVRYDEVAAGAINHAIRFTCRKTQRGYILPATHWASSSHDPNLPPMGLRMRLKADYDISGFSKNNQVILTALKKYGIILADNGGDWFITGAPDSHWNDDELNLLKKVKGSDFEAVDTGKITTG